MKKIIIIALAVVTVSFASCSKDNSVKPSAKAQRTTVADKNDVGVGDNTGDNTPPVGNEDN